MERAMKDLKPGDIFDIGLTLGFSHFDTDEDGRTLAILDGGARYLWVRDPDQKVTLVKCATQRAARTPKQQAA